MNDIVQRNLNFGYGLFKLFLPLCFLCTLLSCEEEFIPEITSDPQDIVVEGYIEAGAFNLPPYVILTRSQPFFSELDIGNFDNFFVHDALVRVSNGTETVMLEELCWNDLDEDQQALVNIFLSQSGLGGLDSIPGNFCVYIDLNLEMIGEIGKTYDLRIEVEDKILTASTTLEPRVPLDSLNFIIPPGDLPDTLKELRTIINDPQDEINFYRYFTSINGGRFIPGYNSVADDALFNGQAFEFPLPKGEPRTGSNGPESFGLYTVGDTVVVKWTTIDGANFNFWNTLEFNAINQGPFSSYTRVETNINGGIGIWGGYSAYYYTQIVE